MAERNRPGADAGDDRPDGEVFDEILDDATGETGDDEPVSRGGGTATREQTKTEDEQPRTKKDAAGVGFFGRIGRFFREVVAELRKVIWPTRKEQLTYTAVVVTFLAVMTAIVVGFDQAFAWAVLWAFGK